MNTDISNRRIIYTPALATNALTTWNPSDKSAGITLSNGNLTATDNLNDSTLHDVRAVASHSAGLYYAEFHVDTSPNSMHLGIANSTEALNANIGNTDNNAIAIDDGGTVWLNGGSVGTASAFVLNDIVCMAVDMGHTNIWFRTNGGIWNNNAANNPATNVGGFSFASMAAGPWFPMVAVRNNNGFTANFGAPATPYAQSVPAGFGNW
jgi:hypothetical protein